MSNQIKPLGELIKDLLSAPPLNKLSEGDRMHAAGLIAGLAQTHGERDQRREMLEGVVRFTQHKKYRAVECATLGTHWRDIEDEDGNLFAMQVPAEIAEAFAADPWKYRNVFAWIPMLRSWALGNEHRYLYGEKAQAK